VTSADNLIRLLQRITTLHSPIFLLRAPGPHHSRWINPRV
jgi:hypothetical protein